MTINSSKINPSEGKIVFTVTVIAALLVMTINLSPNILNAHASIFENIQNADDIGQSVECVIVVVGCDGQGSVGSSGDIPPSPPSPPTCEECFTNNLTPEQIAILEQQAFNGMTIQEACEMFENDPNAIIDESEAIAFLGGIGVSTANAMDLVECLGSLGFNVVP